MSGKELYFTLKKQESRNRTQDVWKGAIFHSKETRKQKFKIRCLERSYISLQRNKKAEIEHKMSGKELYFTLKKQQSRNRKQDVWKGAIFHSEETTKQTFKTRCLEKSYIHSNCTHPTAPIIIISITMITP